MRVLRRLIWLPILFLLLSTVVLFVISNPDTVDVSLWPLSYAPSVPIWAAVLGSFSIGLFTGALFVWFIHLPKRAGLIMANRKIEKIQAELQTLKKQASDKTALEISE